ncbi:thioredoxin family protein [Ignicoccus hospitalis]|uniref:Thioredoxin domain-containing protein n=1 Tax=Ignicoccus hospitalis (strain KIN4/I / DSM 18386 / JCM 14125) TaxID=453591 RepID=A8ABI6_IGNH4|nr:thioredoxin family protein [Ignicoccus hospitalis]ABU82288.1 hypothetical protein Igni_1111 [Ignicoccus hospitalis KIN4/I]HIH90792.1 thioredoxin family protein [Desulfurococcaceae archaeon]
MITSYEEFEEKIKEGVSVVVFTAEWVPASKRLVEKLVEYLENFKVKVIEVDVAMAPRVMSEERVFIIPTVKVYLNGKVVITQEDTTGNVAVDAEHLRRALKEVMKRKGVPLR